MTLYKEAPDPSRSSRRATACSLRTRLSSIVRPTTNRLYGVLPWGIIALDTVHMAATWRFYDTLTPASLWFFNGGIGLVFTGVLIKRRHAPGFLQSAASVSRLPW
jgi:hypothetical protein